MANEVKEAPIIPAGTENTVFGTRSFGQAVPLPTPKPQAEIQLPEPKTLPELDHEVGIELTPPPKTGTTFAELAEKKGFKSPDDLAKSYAELESKKGRLEMGLNELAALRTQPVQQPAPIEVKTENDAIRLVQQIVDQRMQSVVRPLEDKVQLQEFSRLNPDFQQYAGRIAQVVKENPNISWESAYKIAKFDTLQEQSKEAGKQEAYQTIAQKQASVVGQPRPQAQRNEQPLANMVADKNVPWKEVQRIMKERFSQ